MFYLRVKDDIKKWQLVVAVIVNLMMIIHWIVFFDEILSNFYVYMINFFLTIAYFMVTLIAIKKFYKLGNFKNNQ